jgi:glycosyltransferase involved in cell wall biosynthesis
MLADITPLILTCNEQENLERTLARLRWARRVVVIDSFSSDATPSICGSFSNVERIVRAFDDHTSQWNFGLAQVKTPWTLNLDADYVVTDALNQELACWIPGPAMAAYFARFHYCVFGRRLRASLYPPRAVLFRPAACRYVADGHTQRLAIDGPTAFLTASIDHDDRKPLARWLRAQDRYATLEAAKLLQADAGALALQDRLRRLVVVAPLLVPLYTLLGKGLILEGWRGWYYAFQRMAAELILSLKLIEAKLKPRA